MGKKLFGPDIPIGYDGLFITFIGVLRAGGGRNQVIAAFNIFQGFGVKPEIRIIIDNGLEPVKSGFVMCGFKIKLSHIKFFCRQVFQALLNVFFGLDRIFMIRKLINETAEISSAFAAGV